LYNEKANKYFIISLPFLVIPESFADGILAGQFWTILVIIKLIYHGFL